MKISVFGLGYVGAVSAACFAQLGHEVIGVDIAQYKVDAINGGEGPIKENGLNEIIKKAVRNKTLSATTDTKKAIINSEISFICVGTPPKKNGDIELKYLKIVCEEIGKALREKIDHIVVIRSTLFPGNLNNLISIIEKNSGKKNGKDFGIAVNPEFLREGSAIKDFFNPPYIVVGSESLKVAKRTMDVYKGIRSKKFIVKTELAQMIKYVSNSWHALKVSFANEIGSISKKLNIDAKKLMNLFSEDTQLNISSYYMKPGFAYGGSCLPKDLAALKINAKKLKIDTPILSSISLSNFEQIKRAIKLIESKKKKKIGIFGITFKSDTDDIRGNPILYVINYLVNKGYDVKIFDPLINEDNLKDITKSYRTEVHDLINKYNLKEKIKDISKLFYGINDILAQDIIVISNRAKDVKKLKKLNSSKIIIDLQNVVNEKDLPGKYFSLN